MISERQDAGMKKRWICWLMVFLFACSHLQAGPAAAETADGFTYEVLSDGTASITDCTLTGDVEIPSVINGYTVTKLGYQLFWGRDDITSVSIPATVNQLGDLENLQFAYIFSYCYNLKEIKVDPENDTLISMDGVLYTKDQSVLLNYPCAKADTTYRVSSKTRILDCTCFAAVQNLKSLYLDGSDALWKTYTFYSDPDLTVYYLTGGATEEEVEYFLENEDRELFPTYTPVGSETEEEKTNLADKVKEVVAEVVTEGMTDREKATALHDWVINHAYYSFDYSSPNGVLIHGTGLCESYSRAYKLLLDEAGVSSMLVEGYAVNNEGIASDHMWNKVMIDGVWYHVDCTWDDPSGSTEAVSGQEGSTYLLVTDEFISKDHVWEGNKGDAEDHTHELVKTEKHDSTCAEKGTEEYWICSVCHRMFSDENGTTEIPAPIEIDLKPHTVVIDEEVPATETSEGLTEGSHCSVCGKILVAQEVIPALEPSAVKSGWVQENGAWYYYGTEGNALTGLQTIGGVKYIFDGNGAMATGWTKADGKWYYAESSGALCTGWFLDGTTWYFFNDSGEMATGWIYDGSNWYYMKSSGAMATGWLEDGGSWYYLKDNGAMASGEWITSGDSKYFMTESGTMASGWAKDKDDWYYLDPDSGAMATGWVQSGDSWYYMDPETGAMVSDGEVEVNGTTYKFDANGAWIP